MAKITITNPAPFKATRYYHNPMNGKTARVCRICGAHIYGANRSICNRCLNERRGENGKAG